MVWEQYRGVPAARNTSFLSEFNVITGTFAIGFPGASFF